jgi:hypothetical protein
MLVALAAPPAHAARAELAGSELVVADGGRRVPREALVGAVLTLGLEGGGSAEVRIDRITIDPGRPEGDVVLYDLSVDDGGAWQPVCAPEADGAPHAVLQPSPGGRIAIFCTAGALGKCIRFGYRPWATRDGVSLEPYWQACTRMVRADYCGDNRPTTRDGMLIDVYDTLGIQTREGAPGLTFEAAWAADGALCVAHPRVPQNIDLRMIASWCPRLAPRLGPACTEATARRHGAALLFNASRGDGVPEGAR